jgi:hypothetical protein
MALKDRDLSGQVPRETNRFPIELLSQRELLTLRAQVDGLLDLGSIKDIDLGEELTLQLRTVKLLQQEAADDSETPFGQKAQTAMAVQRMLQDLVKLRTEVYNAEFAKQIEGMVIRAFVNCEAAADPALADVMSQVKAAFFEEYEALLAAASPEVT